MNAFVARVAEVRKALVAFVSALTTAVAVGLVPDPYNKWALIVVVVLGTFGVYAVPNTEQVKEPFGVLTAPYSE